MKGMHFIIGRVAVVLSVALLLVQGGSCTLPARGTEPASVVTDLFFALFLLTGVVFPQGPSKQERTKTISVHIDGFMKSKSGSV
jgi:hypothetical protein